MQISPIVFALMIDAKLVSDAHQAGLSPCTDPESFVRWGLTLATFIFVDEGKRAIIDTPAKRHFKWRFAGVPMMAQH